ncbi:transmembrane protein-like [Tropilaelaps mercedesae]|uniref:GDT1 family protein n=1 Tax=Tropilaelaps mercedesae TaxID=418985 RepID=A0A1V9XH74_9ACAR|nr:transmembrane protein-like [Tropilaelaps mercedesae]
MVIAGTILAHSSCSILAVIAGKFVARKISIKTVTYIGGAIFLVFAFVATSVGYEDKPNR